jgi:hypothetical protein
VENLVNVVDALGCYAGRRALVTAQSNYYEHSLVISDDQRDAFEKWFR